MSFYPFSASELRKKANKILSSNKRSYYITSLKKAQALAWMIQDSLAKKETSSLDVSMFMMGRFIISANGTWYGENERFHWEWDKATKTFKVTFDILK